MRIFGCSVADALELNAGKELRDASSLAMAYSSQRQSAKTRSIEWQFTFKEWVDVWEASGKLSLRGVGRGRYVMARHGDEGPYHKSNVSIVLATINSRDGIETRFRMSAV